jgi:hypothetical protein
MTDLFISTDQLKELLRGFELDEKQQAILMAVWNQKMTVPKQHKDAIGVAYYNALSGSQPWDTVNLTGTVIALLITSIRNAGDPRKEKDLIDREHQSWANAMAQYGVKEDDSQKFRAAANCQRILGTIGDLVYKYGTVPTGGFKIPIPSGGNQ